MTDIRIILVRPMQRFVHFCTTFSLLLSPIVTNAKEYAVFTPRPKYPAEAKARHFTGSGVFALHIRPGGHVERVDMIQSIGHPILDDAATTAFLQWRFHPHKTTWILRIPIRYIDGSPRHDAAMSRPPKPDYGVLISVFSRQE
ncbi:MAG TPA: energy transducer TonB [Candidatus Udaeobacter sp.]